MAGKLTPRGIKKLQPKQTAFDQWDSLVTGLGVHVFPSGAKSFTFRFRIGKRRRRLTIGDAKVLTLADARKAARNAMRQVALGHDPCEAKKAERTADTVKEFAQTYLDDWAKPNKRSWRDDQSLLKNEILPHWKHRTLISISRRDVIDLLTQVFKRPAPILSNRLRALLHKLFGYAIERGVVEANPVSGVKRLGVEKKRERVLTDDEIRQFWSKCEGPVGAAFRLRLITGQRGGEVFSMTRKDIDGDWWTIPATVTKNKKPHRVPLSPLAQSILKDLPTGEGFLFRGFRTKRQHRPLYKAINLPEFKGHDLRRTCATRMGVAGVPEFTIGRVLNHQDRGVTAVYNLHGYDREKKAALNAWARTLTAILDETQATVLPFTKKA
jgi:integrase